MCKKNVGGVPVPLLEICRDYSDLEGGSPWDVLRVRR